MNIPEYYFNPKDKVAAIKNMNEVLAGLQSIDHIDYLDEPTEEVLEVTSIEALTAALCTSFFLMQSYRKENRELQRELIKEMEK